MDNRTLEQAFNAVFHNKESFSDFCNFVPEDNVEGFLYNGKRVYKTTKKYKNYLRFLDKVILRYVVNDVSVVHSYVKGRSVLTAVEAHVESSAFFLTDIKSFFTNITKEDVSKVLVRDRKRIPISDFESYIPYLSGIMTVDDSIPVGFPSSPQLSNGFLFDFDKALYDFCRSRDLVYTRYSDDIMISGNDRGKLLDLKNVVQQLLNEFASKKLIINYKKTRITHTGNKVKILGLVITQDGRVTLDLKYKNLVESLLHFYATDKKRYQDLLDKKFGGKEHSVFGLLHYVKSIDPEYLSKLQKKYGLLTLRSLMEDRWSDNR